MRAKPIFADTAFFIALVNPADEAHQRAVQAAEVHSRLVTTEAILIELGNGLAAKRWRWLAVRLLEMLRANPDIEVLPVTTDLLGKAIEMYVKRDDKEWGLTDCISFAVMRQRKIGYVLSLDHHFVQAGFELAM